MSDKPCKGILIDPSTGNVCEVTFTGDYRNIYQHIHASTFEVINVSDDGDAMYVDEEGKLKEDQREFFIIEGRDEVIAGKALILGTDANGDSIDTTMTVDEVKNLISFVIPFSEEDRRSMLFV